MRRLNLNDSSLTNPGITDEWVNETMMAGMCDDYLENAGVRKWRWWAKDQGKLWKTTEEAKAYPGLLSCC